MGVRRHGGLLAAGLAALALFGLPGDGHAAEPGSRQALDEAAVVNTELALAYMKEGNLAAAREKIDKALQQNSRTAGTQMAAGFIYDQLNDKRKAATHYEQAVKLAGKDNPDVVANAAVFFCMNGDPKRGRPRKARSTVARTSPLPTPAAARSATAGRRRLSRISVGHWRSIRSNPNRCSRWRSSRWPAATGCRRARSWSATPRWLRSRRRRSG
jgi:type IV pilus assembly protein PilF